MNDDVDSDDEAHRTSQLNLNQKFSKKDILILTEKSPAGKNPFDDDYPQNYRTESKLIDKIAMDDDTDSDEDHPDLQDSAEFHTQTKTKMKDIIQQMSFQDEFVKEEDEDEYGEGMEDDDEEDAEWDEEGEDEIEDFDKIDGMWFDDGPTLAQRIKTKQLQLELKKQETQVREGVDGKVKAKGISYANGDRVNLNDFDVYFEVFKVPKPMLRDDNIYAEECKIVVKEKKKKKNKDEQTFEEVKSIDPSLSISVLDLNQTKEMLQSADKSLSVSEHKSLTYEHDELAQGSMSFTANLAVDRTIEVNLVPEKKKGRFGNINIKKLKPSVKGIYKGAVKLIKGTKKYRSTEMQTAGKHTVRYFTFQ